MRDEFSVATKKIIAERAGFRCSNPTCGRLTSRANPINSSQSMSIGVAAHIVAASSGGPRADISYTSERRRAPENGLWLCQSCGRAIDVAPDAFPITTLTAWKTYGESQAARESAASRDVIASLINDIDILHLTISEFIEKWQTNEPPVDFDNFSESTRQLIQYSKLRLSAYHREIMPAVRSVITQAAIVFGASPLITEAEVQAMMGPTNYISMHYLDEHMQKLKSNLTLR